MTIEEKNKQLIAENNQYKTEIAKLKTQLADVQKQLVKINDTNASIFYLGILRELRETEKELLEIKSDYKTKIAELERKINSNTQNYQETPKQVVTSAQEKQKLEEVSKKIVNEKHDDITIKQPETKQAPTIEKLDEQISNDFEEKVDMTNFIKVASKEPADDLVMSNAIRELQKVKEIKANDEQEEVKTEQTKTETLSNAEPEIPTITTPSNEIEELTEEAPQQVIAQEPAPQQTKIEDAVTPQIANTIKYMDDNIKAFKKFVQDKVKTIVPFFKDENITVELNKLPSNVQESYDNNIIVMSEVLGEEPTSKAR